MPAPVVTRHDNLPAHRVRLFGRKRDLAIARTELLATEGRLLTMTGTGGCGKTHLALALAASLLNEFDEGVWLFELAPLEDPALLPQLMLSTIGLRERSGEPLVHIRCFCGEYYWDPHARIFRSDRGTFQASINDRTPKPECDCDEVNWF